VSSLRLSGLPLSKLGFLNDTVCVGAGYDMVPIKFTASGPGAWSCEGSMDQGRAKKEKKKSAATMWEDKADRAGQEKHEHNTTHENIISSMFVKPGSDVEFTTAGLDGRIAFWNAASLEGSFKGLSLRNH